MNPQDDPEARIRAMERSLAQEAPASEHSAHGLDFSKPSPGYPPPPPPPPPSPGGSRLAGNWLAVGVLAVCLIGLVASVGIFVSLLGSDRSEEPVRGERPSPTAGKEPRRTSSPGSEAQLAPPGETVSVAGTENTKTIACANGKVSVSGFNNKVTITGFCANVTVSGADNVVMIDGTETINTSGFRNKVTYRTGSPDITKSGFDNVVEQG